MRRSSSAIPRHENPYPRTHTHKHSPHVTFYEPEPLSTGNFTTSSINTTGSGFPPVQFNRSYAPPSEAPYTTPPRRPVQPRPRHPRPDGPQSRSPPHMNNTNRSFYPMPSNDLPPHAASPPQYTENVYPTEDMSRRHERYPPTFHPGSLDDFSEHRTRSTPITQPEGLVPNKPPPTPGQSPLMSRDNSNHSMQSNKSNDSKYNRESNNNINNRTLVLTAVGGFKDLTSKVVPLGTATVSSGPSSTARLTRLKRKLNELHRKRKSYWVRQSGTAGVGAAGMWVSLGGSIALSSAAAVHQRNRLLQVKRAMREVINQLNQLRSVFQGDDGWQMAERAVRVDSGVFTNDIKRTELWGPL